MSASSECWSSDPSIYHFTPHQYGLRPNKTQVAGFANNTSAETRTCSLVEKLGGKSAARGGARTHKATTPRTLVGWSNHLSYPGSHVITTTYRLYTSPPFFSSELMQLCRIRDVRLSASSQDDLFHCMDLLTHFWHHCRETRGKKCRLRWGSTPQPPKH